MLRPEPGSSARALSQLSYLSRTALCFCLLLLMFVFCDRALGPRLTWNWECLMVSRLYLAFLFFLPFPLKKSSFPCTKEQVLTASAPAPAPGLLLEIFSHPNVAATAPRPISLLLLVCSCFCRLSLLFRSWILLHYHSTDSDKIRQRRLNYRRPNVNVAPPGGSTGATSSPEWSQ